MVNVYDFASYKDFLKDVVEDKKASGQALTFSKLADAARIQRSYMSQVINGLQQLSPDQLYLVGKALLMSAEEIEYLLLILDIERCAIAERKLQLEERRQMISNKHRKSEKYLDTEVVVPRPESTFLYYSDFIYPVVHMFLTIKKYLNNPELLCSKLNISKERLADALQMLERCEIITFDKKRYRVNKVNLHLPDSSKVLAIHQQQFRNKAVETRQTASDKDGFFFTASFSSNEETRQYLKKEFLSLLKRFQDRVEKNSDEEVFQINFDLFRY